MTQVLIVDDEIGVRTFIRGYLKLAGLSILEAGTGAEALEVLERESVKTVILDLGLPDMEGFEVTRRVRQTSSIPIIVVSVRDREEEIVRALDLGADDYLVKPFGGPELLARLRAALRRWENSFNDAVFRSGELTVYLEARNVEREGTPVLLTPNEFDVLRALIKGAGRTLTHQQLLRTVWGEQYQDDIQILRVNVSNLRRKLEPQPRRPIHILTELGVGYRLKVHPVPDTEESR